MEIKLRTTSADENGGTIVDEYGALWKCSGPRPVHGIFLATMEGLNGEEILGFYQNGNLFIVNWSYARDYFNSMRERICQIAGTLAATCEACHNIKRDNGAGCRETSLSR